MIEPSLAYVVLVSGILSIIVSFVVVSQGVFNKLICKALPFIVGVSATLLACQVLGIKL